ncbi:glycine zipper 2TM domain-containing protein [Paraglaciecola arctica]|uniref:glycine zipper 2TM domain-containing protein n=1 Tax=Paraglaciecola arctica TaxID=1128911 RepID=UPI001C06C00F|nr:glycine zipper 2TM domain-containing protein [Paraglaciecola arctica]MBU3005522.1 glycine zipper 2TM domain-containing protein [Paraglaciecola arctica]
MNLLITSAVLVLTFSPLALAKHEYSHLNGTKHSQGLLKARVIESTPIYKYVFPPRQKTVCQPISTTHSQSQNKGAVILGGIVGGAIGHAASNDRHKGLGTVVGAVIGSSLAHKIDLSYKHNSKAYHSQKQRCVTQYNQPQKVRVLDGYNVTYSVKGKIYQTFRHERPNRFISIYY